MNIEALIWDLGGVVYATPFELFDEIEVTKGWPPGTLPRGPFARGGDPEYAKCSRGELTESEYWAAYERESARRGFPIALHASMNWDGKVRTEVMDTIETLQDVFVHATLSNDSSTWLGDGWWETWPYRHLFAELIDVKTLGLRKPHPDTYRIAAERLRLEPPQCLFIDDMEVNVRGAEAIGMPGFFFDHTEPARSCRQLLRRLGTR